MFTVAVGKKTFRRKLAGASCAILFVAAYSPSHAQELHYPKDGRLRPLASIYPEDVPSQVALVCQQRFSSSQQEWEKAMTEWRRRNAPALAEATRLQTTVSSALRASRPAVTDIDTWAFVVNARFEALAEALQMLAALGDAQAKPYCADLLATNFGSLTVDMTDARAAASAAVEDLNHPSH